MTNPRRTIFISLAVALVAGVAVAVLWIRACNSATCSICGNVVGSRLKMLMVELGLRSMEAPIDGCIANLKQIDGAKATWALENEKQGTDIPTPKDIFGANGYMRFTPECPHGGTYSIRSVKEKPVCSHAGHTL